MGSHAGALVAASCRATGTQGERASRLDEKGESIFVFGEQRLSTEEGRCTHQARTKPSPNFQPTGSRCLLPPPCSLCHDLPLRRKMEGAAGGEGGGGEGGCFLERDRRLDFLSHFRFRSSRKSCFMLFVSVSLSPPALARRDDVIRAHARYIEKQTCIDHINALVLSRLFPLPTVANDAGHCASAQGILGLRRSDA